jgi:hypothetical protein
MLPTDELICICWKLQLQLPDSSTPRNFCNWRPGNVLLPAAWNLQHKLRIPHFQWDRARACVLAAPVSLSREYRARVAGKKKRGTAAARAEDGLFLFLDYYALILNYSFELGGS